MISASRSVVKYTNDAQKIWSYLNGVICLYKPSGLTANQTRYTLMANLCRDLNELKVRTPRKKVVIEPNVTSTNYLVKVDSEYSDNVLVVGKRYQPNDFTLNYASHLGKFSSGVILFGLNRGTKTAKKIREAHPLRVYHVTGKFGKSTENHFSYGPTTGRATFDHITSAKMNSYLSSLQASHQKKMYELCGVDPQSQTAFELAQQGPLRPIVRNVPLIYSMRCVEFNRPYFTIEIHACNETEAYLGILVHEIAINLKSLANCIQIRCIRESYFTLEDALVKRHWNVETILANLKRCKDIIATHPEILEPLAPQLDEMEPSEPRIEQ